MERKRCELKLLLTVLCFFKPVPSSNTLVLLTQWNFWGVKVKKALFAISMCSNLELRESQATTLTPRPAMHCHYSFINYAFINNCIINLFLKCWMACICEVWHNSPDLKMEKKGLVVKEYITKHDPLLLHRQEGPASSAYGISAKPTTRKEVSR